QEDERLPEVVPVVQEDEDGGRRQGRRRERQQDVDQYLQRPRAVQRGRLVEIAGDAEERLAQQERDQRPSEPVRNDQRPERIEPVELLVDEEERHDGDLARQEHAAEQEHEQRLAAAEAVAGEP